MFGMKFRQPQTNLYYNQLLQMFEYCGGTFFLKIIVSRQFIHIIEIKDTKIFLYKLL